MPVPTRCHRSPSHRVDRDDGSGDDETSGDVEIALMHQHGEDDRGIEAADPFAERRPGVGRPVPDGDVADVGMPVNGELPPDVDVVAVDGDGVNGSVKAVLRQVPECSPRAVAEHADRSETLSADVTEFSPDEQVAVAPGNGMNDVVGTGRSRPGRPLLVVPEGIDRSGTAKR